MSKGDKVQVIESRHESIRPGDIGVVWWEYTQGVGVRFEQPTGDMFHKKIERLAYFARNEVAKTQ